MSTSEEEARKRILETENERPYTYPYSQDIALYKTVETFGVNEVTLTDY